MENKVQPQARSASKFFSRKKVLFAIISIVIIGLVAFYVVGRLTLVAQVNGVLKSIPKAMISASDASGNGFPVALPDGIDTNDRVQLSGGGTFDGTTYCVTGSSLIDRTIVYHVDSSSKDISLGACSAAPTAQKPTGVPVPSLTVIDTTQLGLAWSAIDGAASYSVQCATDTLYTKNVVKVTSAALSNMCSELNPGLQYYARVRANNSAGAGPWSPSLSLMTSKASTAPGGATITATSPTTIAYTWAAVAGASSYVVEWASDTSFASNVESREVAGTSITIKNLKPGTTYYVHIKAITAEFDASLAAFSGTVNVTTPAS